MTMLSVRRCRPVRLVATVAIAGGSVRRWWTRTECTALAVRGRCSGSDSRSWGVVHARSVHAVHGQRAARARRCIRSAGAGLSDWLLRWPSQAALFEGGGHELSARLWAYAGNAAAATTAQRASWTRTACMLSMMNAQNAHDDAFGPQVPACQIGCYGGHRRRLCSRVVDTN